jgi:hypothetical protein
MLVLVVVVVVVLLVFVVVVATAVAVAEATWGSLLLLAVGIRLDSGASSSWAAAACCSSCSASWTMGGVNERSASTAERTCLFSSLTRITLLWSMSSRVPVGETLWGETDIMAVVF